MVRPYDHNFRNCSICGGVGRIRTPGRPWWDIFNRIRCEGCNGAGRVCLLDQVRADVCRFTPKPREMKPGSGVWFA